MKNSNFNSKPAILIVYESTLIYTLKSHQIAILFSVIRKCSFLNEVRTTVSLL